MRTLTRKKRKSKWKHGEEQTSSLLKHPRLSSSTAGDGEEGERPSKHIASSSPPSYREVLSPQSNINLLAYTLLALHSIAYDQLIPVFMHLPPQVNRSTSPEVSLPFKFAGGFGVDVSSSSSMLTRPALQVTPADVTSPSLHVSV